MDKIATRYIDALLRLITARSKETWKAQSSDFLAVAKAFDLIKKREPDMQFSVLDLGCACGGMLFIANHILGHKHNYVGIDLNEYYLEIATDIVRNANFVKGNVKEELAGEFIEKANIVFTYMPTYTTGKGNLVYENVRNNLKSGSYWLMNEPGFKKEEGFEVLGEFARDDAKTGKTRVIVLRKI